MNSERTALADTPRGDAASPLVADRFEYVRLRQLVASPLNPRKSFDPVKLKELADSIFEKGIVEPLVVRPIDAELVDPQDRIPESAFYEIVAGERRFRAAESIGMVTVPCVIRAYTDEDVLELTLVENLQRDGLTPLEQARGFQALLDANRDKYSAATIATKVGMSPQWVWDRLRLLTLIEEAQSLLDGDRISVGHAVVLARLKPEDQARTIGLVDGEFVLDGGLWQPGTADALPYESIDRLATDNSPDAIANEAAAEADPLYGRKPRTVRELEEWIADHVRFDVAHMATAQPLQFEDLSRRVEKAAAEAGRRKGVIPITLTTGLAADAKAEERTYGPQAWRLADGSSDETSWCADAVLGVVVAGPRQGAAFEVCIAKDRCRVHYGEEIRAKEAAEAARQKGQTKKAAKIEKTQQTTWEKREADSRARRQTWDAVWPAIRQAAIDQVKTQQYLTPSQAARLGEDGHALSFDYKLVVEVLGASWFRQLPATLLISEIASYWDDNFERFVKDIATPLELDLVPLRAARDTAVAAYVAEQKAETAQPAPKRKGRK